MRSAGKPRSSTAHRHRNRPAGARSGWRCPRRSAPAFLLELRVPAVPAGVAPAGGHLPCGLGRWTSAPAILDAACGTLQARHPATRPCSASACDTGQLQDLRGPIPCSKARRRIGILPAQLPGATSSPPGQGVCWPSSPGCSAPDGCLLVPVSISTGGGQPEAAYNDRGRAIPPAFWQQPALVRSTVTSAAALDPEAFSYRARWQPLSVGRIEMALAARGNRWCGSPPGTGPSPR